MRNSFSISSVGEFVTIKGWRLHYVSEGLGFPVVMLHGNAGFTHDFSLVMSALAAQGFRAIAFDRPGHGESERPLNEDATVVFQSDLIREALVELGIKNPILVGHSWSALLVLH